jgi:Family of unknown function (DUF6455)
MNEGCYSQKVLYQAELMARMTERIGVDVACAASKDGGLLWYEARTKCLFCRNVQRCSKWLAGLESVGNPVEFCPNAKFFRSCSSESLSHRSIVSTD